jgi:hypothetical protein
VNESPMAMIARSGKYDVSRSLSTAEGSRRLAAPDAVRALPNAA